MSNIRLDFYKAVNEANNYKPKKKDVKIIKEDKISVEDQISLLLKESESAVIVDEVVIENEQVVDWVYNLYKKDEQTIIKEKEAEKLFKEIEEKREIARREWRNIQNMREKFSTFNPSSSSAAAGSGGGHKILGKYYEPGYIDPGYIE